MDSRRSHILQNLRSLDQPQHQILILQPSMSASLAWMKLKRPCWEVHNNYKKYTNASIFSFQHLLIIICPCEPNCYAFLPGYPKIFCFIQTLLAKICLRPRGEIEQKLKSNFLQCNQCFVCKDKYFFLHMVMVSAF